MGPLSSDLKRNKAKVKGISGVAVLLGSGSTPLLPLSRNARLREKTFGIFFTRYLLKKPYACPRAGAIPQALALTAMHLVRSNCILDLTVGRASALRSGPRALFSGIPDTWARRWHAIGMEWREFGIQADPLYEVQTSEITRP